MKRYKETKYLITEDGKVWSEYSNDFLRSWDSYGYKRVCLVINSKKVYVTIHRLVAECYLINSNNYKCINHIDNNRSNNLVENLEWCSYQMNIDHKVNQNRQARGITHGNAKLTVKEVLEIRQLYGSGEHSQQTVANIYKVHRSIVSDIINNKTWKHV